MSRLVPLSAIFTPGTIVTTQASFNTTQLSRVPHIDFGNFSLFVNAYRGMDTDAAEPQNWETWPNLTQLALTSISSGQPLRMPENFIDRKNVSCTLPVNGPALHCDNPNDSVDSQINTFAGSFGNKTLIYYSFVPGDRDHDFLNESAPQFYDLNSTNFLTGSAFTALDIASADAARIYIYAAFTPGDEFDALNTFYPLIADCQLFNASYEVDFLLGGAGQQVHVRSRLLQKPVPSYRYALGDNLRIDTDYQRQRYSTISYGAIMSAFGRIMAGASWMDHQTVTTSQSLYELTPLRSAMRHNQQDRFLPLLEDAFELVVLSLFSNPNYYHIETLTDPVNVTIASYPSVYDYRREELFAAYGISLLFALICIFLGFDAIRDNWYTFSNNFSTILRTTQQLQLAETAYESRGADPLPRRLAAMRLKLSMANGKSAATQFAGFRIVEELPCQDGKAAHLTTLIPEEYPAPAQHREDNTRPDNLGKTAHSRSQYSTNMLCYVRSVQSSNDQVDAGSSATQYTAL